MKRTILLKNLDCANCAAKMERAIAKIPGVIHAQVSFMSQKLILEAEESHFDSILDEAKKAARKIERDVEFLL